MCKDPATKLLAQHLCFSVLFEADFMKLPRLALDSLSSPG